MNENAAQRKDHVDELVGRLAEDYSNRLRDGEKPDIEEYAAQHPSAAAVIRQILPAVEIMGAIPPCVDILTYDLQRNRRNSALGDFEIIRELGRGGMGVVYEARQLSLNRRVALKILPFAAVLDERQIQRFRNEALAVAQLDHPHIVEAYGMGCERSVHFYAMRYVEGETLAQLITQSRSPHQTSHESERLDGRLAAPSSLDTARGMDTVDTTAAAVLPTRRWLGTPEQFQLVARIGVEVAEALDHAHQQGVIHRDIKPGNIIIDQAGKSWVTDFGLARTLTGGTLTKTGDMLGTLRFMSPEQALDKRAVVDHRTDIYSLGATLYELITLSPLFADGDRREVLHQIAFHEPRPLRRINRNIPQQLETIVLKALAKDPQARYETAQDMADDIKRFLENRPVQARRPTLLQHLASWSRRHKRVVWLAAALLFFVTLASTLSATLFYAEKRRADAALVRARTNSQLAEEQRKLAQRRAREAQLAVAEADRQRRLAQIRTAEAETQHRRATVHLSIALLLLELQPRLTQARIWLHNGSADGAAMIELAKILVQEHPQEREAWKLLAEAYDSAGQHAAALKQFEQYTKRYPDSAEALNRLAWILANSPDESVRSPKRAIVVARRAVQLDPKNSWFLNTSGVAHYRAGNWEDAIAAFESSILHGWDDGFNSFFLAMCHWRLNQGSEAKKWYAEGIEKQVPALPIAGRELGLIRREADELLQIGK